MANPVATGKMAAGPRANTQPAVLYKLIFFTVLMAVVPIATYFGSLRWKGSTTYAAISAVLAANVILVGYVVVAFREDGGPTPPLVSKKKQ
ncbi:hypothetical protein IAR55_006290 [Kwoniella newhampshirensis]|uniref:Vacuolar ATPase assembly integral membrane protein VMA21 n=1 Tax=Kwoniella newhampshirensis TaxID=1651941 RepID=A0AAW0YV31_9TREE